MTLHAGIGDLPLALGGTLRQVRLAYVTYGTLAPDGRNAILLTHGYTSSHLFADGGAAASEGSWAQLVGPGRAIDTDRHYVVSSNMLGSAFGSTAPASVNPETGREYGPDFPELTLADIVDAQKRLLDLLGVKHLAAVGLRSPGSNMDALQARLASDPNWNGGHYYRAGGILATMTAIRADTLRRYGAEEALRARLPDQGAVDAEITRQARAWAEAFDGHALLVLGRASNRYDARPDLGRITAKVLYVLSRTDALFPPSLALTVMPALKAAGVEASYFEIDSPHGHIASGADAGKWAGALEKFVKGLK
jgi:homoserine O-acetyltransferase